MQRQNFSTSIIVDNSDADVFKAITHPRAWWSEEIKGSAANINDVFSYHFKDIHRCKVKIIEVVPNKRMVWQILENDFNFIKDKSEWVDTMVAFEISQQGDKTRLEFTHIGLVPEYECYNVCSQGWTHYIQESLRKYITSGVGKPNASERPQTETERRLSQIK